MENGRTEQIIDKLVDMIENGQSVPLSTGKVMVNRDEAVLMLRELENIVNGELKIYREVNDRKGKIINEAKQEAENIIYEAEKTASRIRVTKRIPAMNASFHMEEFTKDEQTALRTANDIYAASLIYTDEMLTEVNDVIAQAYDLIHAQYGRMVESLEEKARLVAENKAELMNSLKELSKEDRYSQILELGQLLSNELYNERQKVRETINAEAVYDTVDAMNAADTPDTIQATEIKEEPHTVRTEITEAPFSDNNPVVSEAAHTSSNPVVSEVSHIAGMGDATPHAHIHKPDNIIIKDADITEITADTSKAADEAVKISTEALATIPLDGFSL